MSMSKEVATMRITSQLRAAEAALDEALLTQSKLLTELISARLGAEETVLVGQPEIMRLLKAQESITASANDLARVHGGLLKIGQEMAVIEDCPDGGPIRKTGALEAKAA